MSWAFPGQGGHKHVNEQSQEYIKDQMAQNGLINDVDADNMLRNITELTYLEKTLMVFRYKFPTICTFV